MNRLENWSSARRVLWTLFGVAGLATLLTLALRPRTPTVPVLVLHRPVAMPVPLLDRCLRLVPATKSWGWFWRARDRVFGPRKPVNLASEIVAVDATGAASLDLGLGEPLFMGEAGLRVWMPSGTAFARLRLRLEAAPGAEVLSRPRVMTADACQASLFTGQSVPLGAGNPAPVANVGLSIDYFPRVHPKSTDLIATLTVSELATNPPVARGTPQALAVRTNLDLAVRLQIPKGRGVVLVTAPAGPPDGRRTAVLLDPP